MSVRLFHRGARIVLVLRRPAPGQEVWWSPHFGTPDWAAVLGQQLRLLGISFEAAGPAQLALTPAGQIQWQAGRCWSIMRLRLDAGSETKRRLVAAAVLRAARYARPGR
jgi:hypothetical protein